MQITRKTALNCFGSLGLALLMATARTPARAEDIMAPDIVVFCEPTLRYFVTDLATLWRQQTGVPVRVFTSPSSALLEEISHRARADLVIAEGEASAAAAVKRQLILPETLRHLWRNQLVVAAKAGEMENESLPFNLAALAGKTPIAIVDPWAASAGADGKKALQALGLWDAVNTRSVGAVDTADASYLLAEGKAELALVYATDVSADHSFAVVDRLPAASYGPIDYWAAETHHAVSPNVKKFAAFLRAGQAQERARADGLEVLP
jgi:molybdate transport system substrate-binding protein